MDFNRFYLASQDLAYAHPYPDFSVSLIPISRPTPTGQYGMRGDCFSRLACEGPAAPSARDVRTKPARARPRQARPSRMTPRDFTSEQFRRAGLIRGVSAREVPAPPSARGVRTSPTWARPRQVRPSRNRHGSTDSFAALGAGRQSGGGVPRPSPCRPTASRDVLHRRATSPRMYSRTPPRDAAPPQDEISPRNNLGSRRAARRDTFGRNELRPP